MVEMFVRCEDCNYENLAQHSFCGMCGAKLPSPRRAVPLGAAEPGSAPEPKPAVFEPQPASAPQRIISGPSLLGLGNEPTERQSINYLLEDEPSGGNWRAWAAVLVLVAAVGGAGWHWSAQIRGWITPPRQNSAVDANSAPQTAITDAPSAGTTAQATTPTPVPETTASTPPPATASPEPTGSQQVQPITDAVARAPETKEDKPLDAAANPPTAEPAAPPAAIQPPKPKIERKAPPVDASAEALETEGENYLYGHGVQADCGRASKSLMAAAAHSSQKAQSVLGTMYATGHCVTRDVPAAYRWFAKALHQDPGNLRLQRDLEVLWQQMTPEEREIAAKTGP